jgi:hypothetical protein
MWNKKGSVLIYSIMVGLVVIILALALAPAVSESIGTARNASVGDTIGLNCTSGLISNFDKAACVASDLTIFYFISALIFIGGAIIVSRVIFDG